MKQKENNMSSVALYDSTTTQQLDTILGAAARAYKKLRLADRDTRALYLEAIADGLDAAGDELVPIAQRESNLPEGRLRGELKRTTFQLRLFAEVVRDGSYLGARIDHADPDWPMGAARPDLRRIQLPLGPALVFAASNFPFAFSVAGGDASSALAAGCPVVIKAHDAHPELSQRTSEVVINSLDQAGAPEGTFGVIFGTEAGRQAVQDPRIRACGFTGSIGGGRALFDLATGRPDPIPFYGELGSNNPIFVTPAADRARGAEIAEEFIGSFTAGSGQFCTKPGTLVLPRGSKVLKELRQAELPASAEMLNENIRSGYVASVEQLQQSGVEVFNSGDEPFGEVPSPILHYAQPQTVLDDPEATLGECFGPSSLITEYDSTDELLALARAFEGQLTAGVQAEDNDGLEVLEQLVEIMAQMAGRVMWNQWPTGVSVTYAQQHGGPYPASTASSSTSVGTAAIERWLRPVAFQGFPQTLLPAELRDSSEVPQMLNGQ